MLQLCKGGGEEARRAKRQDGNTVTRSCEGAVAAALVVVKGQSARQLGKFPEHREREDRTGSADELLLADGKEEPEQKVNPRPVRSGKALDEVRRAKGRRVVAKRSEG